MKVSAQLLSDPKFFSKMGRIPTEEGLLYRSGGDDELPLRRSSGKRKFVFAILAVLAVLLGVSLLSYVCAYATAETISMSEDGEPSSNTIATTSTTSDTSTRTRTTPDSLVIITTVTVTTITTTTTTTLPVAPGPQTTSTTTAAPTTTTPGSTTWRPATNPCDDLPSDPYSLSAPTLLDVYCGHQVQLTFKSVDCVKPEAEHMPVFRSVLVITDHGTNHTYAADGNTKREAKMKVARIAAEQIFGQFGLNYSAAAAARKVVPIPPPHYACTPITTESSLPLEDSFPLEDDFFSAEEAFLGGSETTTPPPTTTYRPSTLRPLPDEPTKLSAVTLLDYTRDYLHQTYTSIQCRTSIPPVFRVQLTINETHSFIGDSDTKRHAKEKAARAAVTEMFLLDYSKSTVIPEPMKPCIPVGIALPYTDDQ